MLNLIRQPKGSKLCGQSTIAMVAGITLDESVKLFGHGTKSYYRDYTRVLNELGVTFAQWKKVDNRKKYDLPRFAIVRLQYVGRRTGHLIAYKDGKFYDPARGIFNSKEELMESYNANIYGRSGKARIDWYMEILGREPKQSMVAGE
jgi:hypothetical protein